MAMDLQINTGTAQTQLTQVSAALDHLHQTITKVGNNAALDKLAARLGTLGQSIPSASAAINRLQATINSLSASGAHVANLSTQVASLTRTLAGVQTAGGNAAAGVNNVGAGARNATAHIGGMNQGLSRLNGLLGLVGGGLTAAAFANFAKESLDALKVLQTFNMQMAQLGGATYAAKQLEFVTSLARETGVSVETLLGTYGKYTQAAAAAGLSSQVVATSFKNLTMAIRTMGLSQMDAERALRAVTQMFSKQGIMAEELRGQLGDAMPAAMGALSKALGKSTSDITKLMEAGKLGIPELIKFTDELGRMGQTGLAEALKSYQSAMALFGNSMFQVKAVFGQNFFDAFKAGLFSLAVALDNVQVQGFIAKLASLGGYILSVLAGAFGLFLQYLGYIGVALDVAGAAIVAVWNNLVDLGNYFNAVLQAGTGFAFSMDMVKAALDYVWPAIVLVGGSLIAWGVITAIVASVTFTISLMSGAMTVLAAASAPTVLAVVAVVAAIIAIGAAILKVLDYFNILPGAYKKFTDGAEKMVQSAKDIIKTLPQVTDQVGMATKALDKVAPATHGAAAGMQNVLAVAGSSLPIWGYSTEAVNAYNQEVKRNSDELIAYSDKIGGVTGDLYELGRAYDSAGASASRMSSAASSASRSTSSPSFVAGPGYQTDSLGRGGSMLSGGTGNLFGYSELDDWDIGGIPGKHSAKTQTTVPSSAWAGAPHYANGTPNTSLPRGGIPAVLHPNEAVIPLSGGRSVPVEMRGAFAGPGGKAGGMDQILQTINQTLIDIRTTSKVNTDRLYERLTAINGTLMSSRSSSSSYSGGSSSGGSSGGGISTGGGAVAGSQRGSASYNAQTPEFQAKLEKMFQQMSTRGEDREQMRMTYDRATFEKSQADYMAQMIDMAKYPGKYYGKVYASGGDGGGDFDLSKPYQYEGQNPGGGGGMFAGGSPNASKDASGGFMATLHPDEAVIPLPDGRRVPVELRGGGGGSGSRETNVSVTINVNATDVDSFRRSEDQVLQEMTRKLERAARNIGRVNEIDDPTQRAQ